MPCKIHTSLLGMSTLLTDRAPAQSRWSMDPCCKNEWMNASIMCSLSYSGLSSNFLRHIQRAFQFPHLCLCHIIPYVRPSSLPNPNPAHFFKSRLNPDYAWGLTSSSSDFLSLLVPQTLIIILPKLVHMLVISLNKLLEIWDHVISYWNANIHTKYYIQWENFIDYILSKIVLCVTTIVGNFWNFKTIHY